MERTAIIVTVLFALSLGYTGTALADGDNGNRVTIPPSILEAEPAMGADDAPLTLIIVHDFACPWCAELAGYDAVPYRDIDETGPLQKIKEQYADSGKLRIVLKDHPQPRSHPNAPAAHRAANCALEQDMDVYWEYHDLLFEERERWIEQGHNMTLSTFLDLANRTGLVMDRFQACYTNSTGAEIREDRQEIQEVAGPVGTPTLFLGTSQDGFYHIRGGLPFETLQPLIEAELSGQNNVTGTLPDPGGQTDVHEGIELEAGWNTLSTTSGAQMAAVTGDCSLRSHQGGLAWTRYNGSWHAAGTILEGGLGYYVYAEEPCTVTVGMGDTDLEGPTIGPGWTMISGNGPLEERSGTCTFVPYQGELLWRYTEDGWTHPDLLDPDQGYFVYVGKRCTLG